MFSDALRTDWDSPKIGNASKSAMHKQASENSFRELPETSTVPAAISAKQEMLFQEVLALFEQNQIAYAVAGAFALREHTGICRDTKDLDVFLTSHNVEVALDCLRKEGFDCQICDPVWLYKAYRGRFFVDLITGMSNAALVVEDSWIERAIPAVVHGVQTSVLAAEELLASKLFVTRRERFDGADIAHVIYGTRGKLDWQRVLSLVGEHWEILFWALVLFRYVYPAQTDYVPKEVWSELIGHFQNAVSNRDPAAKFRGSLIDNKMFAVDVNEWGLDNLLVDFRNRRLREIRGGF
jgi:Nucleotidyl transferase of unknown function (DUF2204)